MKMKKITSVMLALAMLLCMAACSRETVTRSTGSLDQAPQQTATPEPTPESQPEKQPDAGKEPEQEPEQEPEKTAERTVSGTMLLDGKETEVFLEVSDDEISLWDSASGGTLLAEAKYPETLAGAADALTSCDYTDMDGDGNSDPTANFAFADGSTASLVWFFTDGSLVFNEEFSLMPGSTGNAG